MPLTKQRVHILAFMGLLLLSSCLRLAGQTNSNSGYFPLFTAAQVAVSDTISGLNLSVLKVSPQAKHGTLKINILSSGGSGQPYIYQIRYTPNSGFVGLDTFALELNYIGGYPFLVYRAYQVSVYPALILTKADYATTLVNKPITLDVLANDSSPGGSNLTLHTIPLTNYGTATITNDQRILFTPQAGFSGIAHLQYVVCNAQQNCKTEQASIGVHPAAPLPNDTLYLATKKGKTIQAPLVVDGFNVFQPPSNGTLTISGGQLIEYKPNPGFTGKDMFILHNTIWGTPFYKTVVVQVLDVLTPNTMAMEDLVYTPIGKPVSFNVRTNDIGNLMVKGWSIPANLPGTVTGTSSAGTVTFTPKPNFSGVATFYYKIGNMNVPDLEIAPINVIVGNLPPKFEQYNFTTPVETPFVLHYKIPFNTFNFEVSASPKHGKCTYFPGYSSQTIQGQTVTGYNLLIYTPVSGYSGTDAFEIKYCVTANGTCKSEKINMFVTDISTAEPPYCLQNCVWTGDLNDDGTVDNKDLLVLGRAIGRQGITRANASLEWYGQFGNNWNNPFTGLKNDVKHADTDGNGQITAGDTSAIGAFYGQSHQFTPNLPTLGKGIPFSLKLLTPNPGIGDRVSVEVSIGSPNFPVVDLYGFTFDVQLGSTMLDSALSLTYLPNSWINRNSPALWMAKNTGPGKLETAFTRTNQSAICGNGPVAELDFIIIDIVHGGKSDESDKAILTLNAAQFVGTDGAPGICQDITLEIPIRTYSNGRDGQISPISDRDLIVYPTPASKLLQVKWNGAAPLEALRLYDAGGRLAYCAVNTTNTSTQIPVEKLPPGLYILSAQTNTGLVNKKIQIQH